MTPGELRRLLDRCRVDDPTAGERFTRLVHARGKATLASFGSLSRTDRDDVIGASLDRLLSAIRSGGIHGHSNSGIDAYICKVVIRQAFNLLRNRDRYGDTNQPRPGGSADRESQNGDVADDRPSQEGCSISSERLRRALKLLESWSLADQYLYFAKINGVPAKEIQHGLGQLGVAIKLGTVDTWFHRLRSQLLCHMKES